MFALTGSRLPALLSGLAILGLILGEAYRYQSPPDRTDYCVIAAAFAEQFAYRLVVFEDTAWWLVPQWALTIVVAAYVITTRRRARPSRRSRQRRA